YVFNDTNNDGQRNRRESGVAGVAISNGIDVILTDAQGRYTLPVGEDNIIFVIKPSGYAVPVGENNLPKYYHIHKPQGSPQLKYGGVSPTGPLPKSVDFPLVQKEESSEF